MDDSEAMVFPCRIAIVDDDEMMLASLRRQLRKLPNCKLLFFDRATEALESIVDEPVDIVLTDIQMPVMDGIEFLKRLSKVSPTTLRMAWSGNADPRIIAPVFPLTPLVFSKPCPAQRLSDLLGALISFFDQMRSKGLATRDGNQPEQNLLKTCLNGIKVEFQDILIAGD